MPTDRTAYRKPRADIYTVLLILSLVAIIVGITLLWFEMSDYGPNALKNAPTVSLEHREAFDIALNRSDWFRSACIAQHSVPVSFPERLINYQT